MIPKSIRAGLSLGLIVSLSSWAGAQERGAGNPRESVRRAFERSGLDEGEPFPDVTIYDAEGEEFQTRELRGDYSVLVTGCLT